MWPYSKKQKKMNSYESPKFIEDIIEPVPPPLWFNFGSNGPSVCPFQRPPLKGAPVCGQDTQKGFQERKRTQKNWPATKGSTLFGRLFDAV